MSRRVFSSFAFALTTLALVEGAALADLQQPDGTTIPVGTSLQDLFSGRGEAIQAVPDAFNIPETFVPSCALDFEVLQRNAGYMNSFGWYNVTGTKPSDAELHEFLACSDPVGTKKTLAIKQDPAYLGGEIGFYQATGPCGSIGNYLNLFFSEKKYNPDGNQANPYTHLLIYNSTVVPQAFYFAWEDLLSGGDNDFDDLTTFVTGITCSGGGGTCQTGQLGICADGTMQCQSGVLACLPLNQPAPEQCNALDDDCNGVVDEGDLCPSGEVCDKGTCVPACSGEVGCPPDEVCNGAGYCVDPACLNVDCPTGQKCVSGQCVGPCDGVVCPYGQICLVGACKDPCAAITCDADQICVLGACTEKCQCAGCAATETCQPDGACLATPCVGKTCNAGEHCAPDGTCVDDCADAKCPTGQICQTGECVADPNAGTGGGGGGTGGGLFDTGGSGGASAGNGGAGAASGARPGAVEASGCGCRVGGDGTSAAGLAAALGLLGLLAARRRR